MFAKKPHVDVKKSSIKALDTKKDSLYRIKHLRIYLDNVDILEAKNFFDYHYSHIYYIFFDTLSSLEGGFKHKGHKQVKEELDSVLFILEKILVFLPELIRRRWQFHSLSIVLRKLLHPLNSIKVRQEGIRCFLLWFQILGHPVNHEVKAMFESLVPLTPGPLLAPSPPTVPVTPECTIQKEANAFYPKIQKEGNPLSYPKTQKEGNALFYPSSATLLSPFVGTVEAVEIEPLIPALREDPVPRDVPSFYLQSVLDFMVTQVTKIVWKDNRQMMQMKCFQFLFDQFKDSYIKLIFPELDEEYDIFGANFDLPSLRTSDVHEVISDPRMAFMNRDSPSNLKSVVIRWLSRYLSKESETIPRDLFSIEGFKPAPGSHPSPDLFQNKDLFSNKDLFQNKDQFQNSRPPTTYEYDVVRTILCSSRSNVNLVHELLRQAFLLPLTQSMTMRQVLQVYKEWINSCSNDDMIPFLHEPSHDPHHPSASLDSDTRLGLSRILRAFVTNASNIFLLKLPSDRPLVLEEQVEMCKRVLNSYRYMVMKVEMDRETWEQLLLVMLRITSLVLSQQVPIRKEESLGGRLAPAFFQTLIVTWIRANINVPLPLSIWHEFQTTIVLLSGWEEMVREWTKTMDTITRVMSRYVYNVNLHDLPLERMTGDKKDRRKVKQKVEGSLPSKPVPIIKSPTTDTIDGNRTSRSASSSQSRRIKRRKLLSRSVSDSYIYSSTKGSISGRKGSASGQRGSASGQRGSFGGKGSSKSADELSRRSRSPTGSDDGSDNSRSPSPTPSSNNDSGSLKDSPMNLDAVSMSSNSSAPNTRSVIVGGSYRGWNVESSVILWRRMLGVLGDVNALSNPDNHAMVMESLAKTIDDLIKVKENIGLTDNGSRLAPSNLVPPIGYFSPWLLRCLQLPDEYRRGKLVALRSLCQITLRRHEVSPSADFMCHVYKILAEGLASKDVDYINTIMKSCSTSLFTLGSPGSTLLLNPLLEACTFVITADARKEAEHRMPRNEAIAILGSIIGLITYFDQIQKVYQPLHSPEKPGKDLKDRVLALLLRGCKKELSVSGRCLALNCLGIYVYQELSSRNNPIHHFEETISTLLSATQYHDRVLVRVACDAIRLQADHAVTLLDNHTDIPRRIIQDLCSSLTFHFHNNFPNESLKEFILSIVMCLGHWLMAVPLDWLKSPPLTDPSGSSLLSIVVTTLSDIVCPPEERQDQNGGPSSDFDGDMTLTEEGTIGSNRRTPSRDRVMDVAKLAAKMLLAFLVNHLGHFPRSQLTSSRLNCFLNEGSDNELVLSKVGSDEKQELLSMEALTCPSSLFFIVNDSSIVSFTELPGEGNRRGSEEKKEGNRRGSEEKRVRVITRDLIGKFAWDSVQLMEVSKSEGSIGTKLPETEKHVSERTSDEFDDSDPEVIASKPDLLDTLYQLIGSTTPESMTLKKGRSSQSPASSIHSSSAQEENMIALLLNQHYQEMSHIEKSSEGRDVFRRRISPTISSDSQSSQHVEPLFVQARRLIDQLSFFSWERRRSVELLARNDRVLREIKNLDSQRCRETHKIAVIYVADGQEEKSSILTNSSGSHAFESFVSGLGWEIELESHLGFMGGLQSNGSTGKSTPYFATSFMEVIFHVSTRIPARVEDSESLTRKLRHLGNDEVHIVWSENSVRDYRRGIIPTEFGDVLIVIYPLSNPADFFRIQIIRKPDVPFFGPLFDGSVVHSTILAPLVRATAINASRAQRTNVPFYHHFFEERAKCIEAILKNKEKKSFEDFAATCFNPIQSLSSIAPSPSPRSPSRQNHPTTLEGAGRSPSRQNHPPTLEELGDREPSPKPRIRPFSSGQYPADALITRTMSDSGHRDRHQHRPLSSSTTSPVVES